MRRRSMSHNVKRLPVRLRRAAEHRMTKSLANANKKTKAKAASRRQKRRPKNLREKFEKRQGDKVWLETHLWHAKRFKMAQQWGYKLPLHPCDKGVRAAYRSTVKHCTIQEISFYEVIEVKGRQENIIESLCQLTCPETGLTLGAEMYLSGQHHGETMLYHKGTFPYGAITKVQFLWQCLTLTDPIKDESTSAAPSADRKLWMWVHPSAFSEVLDAIKVIIESDSIKVNDLRGELLRFRLRGPQATAVVTDAFKVSSIPPKSDTESEGSFWWQDKICQNPNLMTIHEQQSHFWKSLESIQSTTALPSRCVVGLTVRDPRILLPKQRHKVETDPLKADYSLPRCPQPGAQHAVSHIWDGSIRESLGSTMLSTHTINEHRRNLLVPGSELDLGNQESRIPVLLLQSPGVQHDNLATSSHEMVSPLGFGGGWDVVLPKKWGTVFWVGFVFRGARAVGLKESDNTCLHQGQPRLPEEYPDTKSGQEIEEIRAKDLEASFLRRPPAKRPNYAKLGFLSPFKCPWDRLLSEWTSKYDLNDNQQLGLNDSQQLGLNDNQQLGLNDSQQLGERNGGATQLLSGLPDFYILRNRAHLRQLRSIFLTAAKNQAGSKGPVVTGGPSSKDLHQLDQRALVWIRVDLLQRGSPEAFSMICLPKPCDLEALNLKKPNPAPEETIKNKFKLDKKQKIGKPKPENKVTLEEKVANANLLELNSRIIIGFVTNGGHVFSRGKGHAVGFCCLPGLLQLVKESVNYVLVRDSNSTKYRFATLTVLE
ncbi:ribonucleases P/MRP protein subunit POP1-like isoform X2 [Apostichopus japonicus]